jgi:hypothetical protein
MCPATLSTPTLYSLHLCLSSMCQALTTCMSWCQFITSLRIARLGWVHGRREWKIQGAKSCPPRLNDSLGQPGRPHPSLSPRCAPSQTLAQAFPVCTPVRFVIYPWIATVTQGYTDSIEGVSTGNVHSPAGVVGATARCSAALVSGSVTCAYAHALPVLRSAVRICILRVSDREGGLCMQRVSPPPGGPIACFGCFSLAPRTAAFLPAR